MLNNICQVKLGKLSFFSDTCYFLLPPVVLLNRAKVKMSSINTCRGLWVVCVICEVNSLHVILLQLFVISLPHSFQWSLLPLLLIALPREDLYVWSVSISVGVFICLTFVLQQTHTYLHIACENSRTLHYPIRVGFFGVNGYFYYLYKDRDKPR